MRKANEMYIFDRENAEDVVDDDRGNEIEEMDKIKRNGNRRQ